MASDFIDIVLQMLVERDIFQGTPTWRQLKDYLAQTCMMAPDRLEERRNEIVENFIRCKREQLEKALPELMGMTSNEAAFASPDSDSIDKAIPESAGQDKRLDQAKDAGSKEEAGEEEEEVSEPTFHPEIDEKLSTDVAQSEGLQSERACFMSICLPNGQWKGAALKYCKHDESYVSLKIIERHKLENHISEDGRIRLTWHLCDKEDTDLTQFTVHKGLSCDFMLGERCFDEEFNRGDSSDEDEDADSASSMSKYSEPMESPLPQMYSLPGQMSPNPLEFAKLVGVANAESIVAMMRETAISQSGSQRPRRGRRPAEDVQSAPSLVPSYRRSQQSKGGPPTDIAVEPPSAKRRNARR